MKTKGKFEREFEKRFERHVNTAATSVFKNLKLNGYKLDSQDKALLLNELRYYFYAREYELVKALNNADFHLDEFSSGYCSVPRRGKPEGVAKAVEEAMGTLRTSLARVQRQRHTLRLALAQVKVDHLNKRTKLPMKTHALVENALHETK